MSPPHPPSSTPILPPAHGNLHSTVTSLHRLTLGTTLRARLHSIASDARFVTAVATAYAPLPVVANERCGSWYIAPGRKAGGVYFKSTDGHFGEWSASLRRLNVGVLGTVGANGGCIIVDSTRRGKSMPDALSKTVPIWVAVLNRLLFPDEVEAHELKTPVEVVSRSEHAQIEARLPSFVREFRSLDLDVEGLRTKLGNRPMRPVWVTPDSDIPSEPPERDHSNLIVLCTASGRTSSEDPATPDYVQGAADDSESWARGLDAVTFWEHSERLLHTEEDDLPAAIDSILAAKPDQCDAKAPKSIVPASSVHIGDNAAAERYGADFDVVVTCSEQPSIPLSERLKDRYIHLRCGTGKVGSRQLRAELYKLERLEQLLSPGKRVLFACPSGRDIAVGAALTGICLLCDDSGSFDPSAAPVDRTKTLIKKRLSWIMVSLPDATPSRATLQSVNAYLLSERGRCDHG